MDTEYLPQQTAYINSVDGNAHQSAVDIIGVLEKQRDELLRACKLACITCFQKTPEACEDCAVGEAIAKAKGGE